MVAGAETPAAASRQQARFEVRCGYTIGFTQTSAERFFDRLSEAGVRRVIDIRLHNTNQLAGFAKRDDLAYFLGALANIEYMHELSLAPDEALLDAYRKRQIPAAEFETRYRASSPSAALNARCSAPTSRMHACSARSR